MLRAALTAVLVASLAAGAAHGRPAKGDGPTTIAAGYGSVWVGTGNGTLVRLDAGSGRVTGRLLRDRLAQYGYVHSLALGFGSVWVAQGGYDTLKRVDPRTNRARDVRPRGRWTATAVSAGSGAVWVGDPERDVVFRVDPRTNRVVARIPVPGRLWGLQAGRGGAWVVTVPGERVTAEVPREVRRIDVRANRIGPPLVRSRCDFALAAGSRGLWVSDLCAKTLTRIGGPPLAFDVPETSVSVVERAGELWFLSQTSRAVTRLDLARRRVVATIPVRGTWLAAGAASVWVLDMGDGRVGFVRRIDPRTNRVVGRPIRIAPG